MKLFIPEAANHFVFAVVPINAKEGTAPEYKIAPGPDNETSFQRNLANKYRMAAPTVAGRYDELGRYMVYNAPIDGIRPGKYVLHPHSNDERKREEAFS